MGQPISPLVPSRNSTTGARSRISALSSARASTPARASSSGSDASASSSTSGSPLAPAVDLPPVVAVVPAPPAPAGRAVALPPTASSGKQPKPHLTANTHLQRVEPGCQPDAVYVAALNPVREAVREFIAHRMPEESERLARWQRAVRSPARDTFFYWSAIFGTHTFFTAFLPLLFFLGLPEKGRGLLYVVGLGIYVSCVAKDLVCSPRPFTPPVTRLSMSTHHREYGFPSSHSTNAISIALFVGQWVWECRESLGYAAVGLGWVVLFAYYAIIAGGRLYTGMHSTWDVLGGSLLGIACWAAWQLVADACEAWVNTGTLWVAGISVPLTLGLVHYHPETPDDCPCFEDAIAILAVICGSFLGHLDAARNAPHLGPSIWIHGPFWGMVTSLIRIVVGISLIFTWRLVAKSACLRMLPTIFRIVSRVFDRPLPTRRFYTAATAYRGVADAPIHPVPSFGRLPTTDTDTPSPSPARGSPSLLVATKMDRVVSGGGYSSSGSEYEGVRMRVRANSRGTNVQTNGNANPAADASAAKANGAALHKPKHEHAHHDHKHGHKTRVDLAAGNGHRPQRKSGTESHYDAEVLTKVIVYGGIGFLATHLIPQLFPVIEPHLALP